MVHANFAPRPPGLPRCARPLGCPLGSSYLFMPDMAQPQQQRIPFIANFSNSSAILHWFVNDGFIGTSNSGEAIFWPLHKGKQRIVCADAKGRNCGVVISVK